MVIAGSSFASMFFLSQLPASLRILVVEKGQIIPHDAQVGQSLQPIEDFDIRNHSDLVKRFTSHRMFGGNSNCWWACTPRFHPNDFVLNTRYGVGRDWPFGYAELQPYYQQAESKMEIAGGGSDAVLPRNAPFAYTPHEPSRSDRALMDHSALWWMQPTARANGGTRAQCCTNGICHLCPVDAKFSILNGLDGFVRPGVFLLPEAELRAVDRANGLGRYAVVKHSEGVTDIRADGFALGCNAIFNAAILLRSGLEGDATGRYLHEQVGKAVFVDIGEGQGGLFGSTSIGGHGYPLYDGDWRSESGAVLIENHNAPPPIRPEPGR